VRNVPAYRRFLQDADVRGRALFPLGILERLPETDTRSYGLGEGPFAADAARIKQRRIVRA
jgi:phenylacetate-coenzyme A ligase PaaK-like adenylate-forming protein